MLHRGDIERRDPEQIAKLLTGAFDRFCAVTTPAPNRTA
jgi:hypothetical protein